jgi:hydroxymethylbilane synthase
MGQETVARHTSATSRRRVRIGTRGSPLARWQTETFLRIVQARLQQAGPHFGFAADDFDIEVIAVTGDQIQDRRLAEIGGKGMFAKEIHEALLDRRIDCAVHSLKDLETTFPERIILACTMAREDARDALILRPGINADAGDFRTVLPQGAQIGTASLRRQAQLLHARPDLAVSLLRGNVRTRLDRVKAGGIDATLLALAGVKRLGFADEVSLVLDPEHMLPAAGQGIVGVTARADDTDLRALLANIEDRAARVVATAERSLLAALDGSCRTPIGAYAQLDAGDHLRLTGLAARGDGSFLLRRSLEGPASDAARLGAALGAELRRESPADIFLD